MQGGQLCTYYQFTMQQTKYRYRCLMRHACMICDAAIETEEEKLIGWKGEVPQLEVWFKWQGSAHMNMSMALRTPACTACLTIYASSHLHDSPVTHIPLK